MNVQNGNAYHSNYARAAAFYLGTCAPAPTSGERLRAYTLITDLYEAIARDPAAIGVKPTNDVSFGAWEPQKGREKDIKSIRDPIAKIEKLIAELFAIAKTGEPAEGGALLAEDAVLSRTLQKALGQVGVQVVKTEGRTALSLPQGCLNGLKELAAISLAHTIPITDGPQESKAYLYFSRCVFEPDENWLAPAFDRLLHADGSFIWLCGQLEARGYRRVDCFDGKKITLDYIKQHGKKEEPLKSAWAERTHSGMEASYEELRLNPGFVWVRMPMFKTLLASMEKLPEDVARFIDGHTKTCDGCGYCVQTDKTHTRPRAAIPYAGKAKCPYYPGFTFNWQEMSPKLAKDILALLEAVSAIV